MNRMRELYPEKPVYIVDDEASWLKSLGLLLERSLGLTHLRLCQDSREVMSRLEEEPASLVLLDVTMPFVTGEELIEQIKLVYPDLPVIVISGRNQVDIAVRCMKHGAFDYFVKTVDEQRLLTGVRNAMVMNNLRSENHLLKESLLADKVRHQEAFSAIVTNSPVMLSLFRYVEAIANSPEPVLITGESGVGKDLVGRAIHQLSNPDGPWVACNVAGLDDQVFSDTLFGHVRGAFTDARESRAGMIEKARGGTLFLDEIGDLSLSSQVKLLRLLQENEYMPLGSDTPKKSDARFVFATNQDLSDRLEQGLFRSDLFYRLNTHRIHLPPLRERREDIPLLVDHFLDEAATSLGKSKPTIPPQLLTLLENHTFPGNVRELRAMVFDAVSQHQGGVLSTQCFKQAMYGISGMSDSKKPGARGGSGGKQIVFPEVLPTLKEVADLLVDEALRRTENNQTQAALLLGVTRPALSKRLSGRKSKSERGS